MTVESVGAADRDMPTRHGVIAAAQAVAAVVPPTPLLPLTVDGVTLWCKAECLSPVGSFKYRGAWWRLVNLGEAERRAGVVAFSSGNHAQGVAWAAQRLGMSATIVMPADAPRAKRLATEALGAAVHPYDRRTEDRIAIATELATRSRAVLVPSFDDRYVIEGQGSAGVEAAAQLDRAVPGARFDRVVACCGGGGLAAGLALALPEAAIVTAEPEGWDDMAASLAGGAIVPVPADAPDTACDALHTPRVSELTFGVLKARRAHGVAVSERAVRDAQRLAAERLRLVVEPGGAAALAALLSGQVPSGGTMLVTLSGGNVDRLRYAGVLGGAD